MISKKPESHQQSLSSYLDNYTDADGWKPNTSDKSVIQEAIQALDSVSDPFAQKIAALELIKSFDQNGVKANEWLKSNVQTSPYTPELMGALKKLIGVWNRKLRGVKTYVYVNEIINFLIYDLHQKNPIESRKPSLSSVAKSVEEKSAMPSTLDNVTPLKFVTKDLSTSQAPTLELNSEPKFIPANIQIPVENIQKPIIASKPLAVETPSFITATELKLEPTSTNITPPTNNLIPAVDRPLSPLESALKKASQELSDAKLQAKPAELLTNTTVNKPELDKQEEKMSLILGKMDQIINDFKELKTLFAAEEKVKNILK